MITTQEQLPDLAPHQVTIAVNGEVHLGGITDLPSDAPGGFILQVPSSQATVYLGRTGVSATASNAARGIGLLADAVFPLNVRSLNGWYVTGTATYITVLAAKART
jgi:hypothetical protein